MIDLSQKERLIDSEIEELVLEIRESFYREESIRLELTDSAINDLASRARQEKNDLAREIIVVWAARLIAPHPAHIQWIKYSSVSPEDMWQEGRIAVMIAIEKYDVARGYDFGAYAARIVSNTLGEWAERHSLVISVPRHARRRLRKEGVVDETTRLAKVAEYLPRYLSSLSYSPSSGSGGGAGGGGEDYATNLAILHQATLMDRNSSSVGGGSPEMETTRQEEKQEVRRAYLSLDSLEQKVLYYRYVVELSLEKVHRITKLSTPFLRGLEYEALQHLLEALEAYLGDKNENTVFTPEEKQAG